MSSQNRYDAEYGHGLMLTEWDEEGRHLERRRRAFQRDLQAKRIVCMICLVIGLAIGAFATAYWPFPGLVKP